MRASNVVWDQLHLQIVVNSFGPILVPERHISKPKLRQRSRMRPRFLRRLGRDINVVDVANVNMRRKDVQARYLRLCIPQNLRQVILTNTTFTNYLSDPSQASPARPQRSSTLQPSLNPAHLLFHILDNLLPLFFLYQSLLQFLRASEERPYPTSANKSRNRQTTV